ncbi:MAG: hypothetical protein GAK35_02610 [Herbaspirillum frisingense]|uniref:Uncharacterized protein n=1 Tax=Herbaspirillum frisingense TaxID=92645 RepID=A0A7V8FVR3_9BURK|nr:MAG: hypothetical protein GAK35_02610 [Herbaspirillum frisingense]
MQVLHRTGEDRDKRAASDAASNALAPPDLEDNIIVDDELEIRASHITAAAVAAASVTAAVVTAAAEAQALAAEPASRPDAPAEPAVALHNTALEPLPTFAPAPEPESSPESSPFPAAEPQVQTAARAQSAQYVGAPQVPTASTRGVWLVSLLTVFGIAMALWLSAQAQWPQRALKPMVQHLPSLRNPAPAPVVAPVVVAPAAEPASAGDAIALLQQEAEEKTRLLAQKRAAAEERHRREDAAQAQRELRRRQAEAQLAAARAKAERSQGAVLETPEIVEVPAAPSLADQVKQCSALSLFAREGCLWKLCNGKWGKDGCPAYERNNDGA